MPTAIVTGASRGLGKALAAELVRRSWSVVIDARNEADLSAAASQIAAASEIGAVSVVAAASAVAGGTAQLIAIAGDVNDPDHRQALVDQAERLGGLDLLVNNASTLGPTPLPHLATYPAGELAEVLTSNVVAPLALIQLALPQLARSARAQVINITSDASVEHYEGWGGYGASKAAFDHLTLTFAAERSEVSFYALDPGDMRTVMHQDAFPGEDISDRPLPEESAVPGLLALIQGDFPSGRYKAAALLAEVVAS